MVSGTTVSSNRMAGDRERQSRGGADAGEHEALGQELRDQPAAARAERGAHGHFTAARRAA